MDGGMLLNKEKGDWLAYISSCGTLGGTYIGAR